MTAAAPSWLELESLLDVPHVTDYDGQIAVMREWRRDNLQQLAAIRGKTVDEGTSASYLHLVAACREELRLIEAWLADHDEPFEVPE